MKQHLLTLAFVAIFALPSMAFAQETPHNKITAAEAANKTKDFATGLYHQLLPKNALKGDNKDRYNVICAPNKGFHANKPLCKIIVVKQKTWTGKPVFETSPLGIVFMTVLTRQGSKNTPAKQAKEHVKHIKTLTRSKKETLDSLIAGVFMHWFAACNQTTCQRPEKFGVYMSQLIRYVINNGNNAEVKAAKYTKKILKL